MVELEAQLLAIHEQARSARAKAKKKTSLLKTEQEACRPARDRVVVVQGDIEKRAQQYDQLKLKDS